MYTLGPRKEYCQMASAAVWLSYWVQRNADVLLQVLRLLRYLRFADS